MTNSGDKIGFREILAESFGGAVYRFLKWLSDNLVKVILILAVIVLSLVFLGQMVKPFFFIAVFLFLSSISLIYNRWVKASIGIEFITLSTVMTARVYGGIVGAIVGLVGLASAEVIGTGFNAKTVISLFGIFIIGLITPFFNGMSVTVAGIILAIIYDAIIIPLYLLAGSRPISSAVFVVSHLIFNTWLFFYIAPFLEHVMV
ncbi:MAG: hypothetical protein EPN86_02540 [Nanoarchaeota archaeon]|nr:MAG: hypothetical protein EPN86_02540 [Nanoarchaeota archaeon]